MRGSSKRKLIVDEAVVLRVTPVGDADAIVTLLSEEHGKIRASVKRIRSVSSGFAGRFELLNHLALKYQPGRELVSVREVRTLTPSFDVVSQHRLQPYGCYIAELADELLIDRDPLPRAARLLVKAVYALSHGADPRLVARYVEYWLLRLTGHVPDERSCAVCGRPLAGEGALAIGRDGLVCRGCGKASRETLAWLDPRVLLAIVAVRSRDVVDFIAEPLPEDQMRPLQSFNRTLLSEVTGRELRSAAYMRRYHLDLV